MANQMCPQCGCIVGDKAFKRGGVVYCCEPCANGCKCECGCVDESARAERHAPLKGKRGKPS
ncbi:MAG: hypothetical protein LLG97_19110 [Deltaproteobacteria bacterium]|nr:hypothetical protein [Deltaproteobacteria bacterium]